MITTTMALLSALVALVSYLYTETFFGTSETASAFQTSKEYSMHSERFAFIRVIENFLFLMFAILFLLTGSYGVFHDFNKTALRNGNFIQDLALLLAGVFFSIATIQVWKYGKAKITFIKMEAIKSQGSKDFNNFILYHKIDDSIYMVLNVDDALSGKFKNFLVITADSLKNYKFEVLSRSELESYQKNSVKSTDKE